MIVNIRIIANTCYYSLQKILSARLLLKKLKINAMLKREWVRKTTGSYSTYSIPGKTAAMVAEFAVEDLTSAELQPRFHRLQWRNCLGQNTLIRFYVEQVFFQLLVFCIYIFLILKQKVLFLSQTLESLENYMMNITIVFRRIQIHF